MDLPRCELLSLLQKPLHYKEGDRRSQAIVRSGAGCASQVLLDNGAEAVARGAASCASQVLDRGAQADARGATHALDRGVLERELELIQTHMTDKPMTRVEVGAGPCPRRHSLCVACTWPWCKDRCLRP